MELSNLLVPTASNDYNYTGKVTLREYVNVLKDQDVDGITLMKDDESNIDAMFIEQGYVTFTIGGYVYEIKVKKIENIDESTTDEFSKYYVIGSGYLAKLSETGPNLNVELTSTSNKITSSIKYSNIDEKGTFMYYYKLQEEEESKYKLATTQTGVTSNPTAYVFEGLQQDKIYNIKIVATNSNKITTTKILEKRTGQVTIAEGNIDFGEVTWNDTTHTASITINKGSGITESIQYQIGSTTGIWQNGETALGIQNGQTVYARLWDGTNGGETISVEVTDTKNPQKATINLSTTTTAKNIDFSATVTHIDNESGIDITKCKYVLNTDSSEIIDESDYTENFTYNGIAVTLNTDTAGIYYLHVLTVDYEDNKTQTISQVINIMEQLYTWAKYNAVGTTSYSIKSFNGVAGLSSAMVCHGAYHGDSASINQSKGGFDVHYTSRTFGQDNRGCYHNAYYEVDGISGSPYNGFYRAVSSGYTSSAKYIAMCPYKSNKRTNNNSSTWASWYANFCYVDGTTIYSKGTTQYDNVTSTSPTAYPTNGYQSGYWYVKQE